MVVAFWHALRFLNLCVGCVQVSQSVEKQQVGDLLDDLDGVGDAAKATTEALVMSSQLSGL